MLNQYSKQLMILWKARKSGCCLEIMKIFFWKMCNAKECIELKNDISQFKSPFGKCAMQKNALNSKMSIFSLIQLRYTLDSKISVHI